MEIAIQGIDKIISNLDSSIARKAVVAALNRTTASAKTAIKRTIRETYTLKTQAIERALKVEKANYSKLRTEIRSSFLDGIKKALPLFSFEARPVEISARAKVPVSVRIRKDKGRRRVKGAPHLTGKPFVAQMPSGHKGIFQRIPGTQMAKKKKEKIQELYTFFVLRILDQRRIRAVVDGIINEKFPKEFENAYKFYRDAKKF